VKLNGEQHPLGKHPADAAAPKKKDGKWNPPATILQSFYELMALRDTASQADYTVDTLCGLYLESVADRDAELLKRYEPILGNFCDHAYKKAGRRVGKLLVNAELDTEHLEDWASTFTSDQTQRTYINCVKAVLDWAVAKKRINVTKNPLSGVVAPKVKSRATIIYKAEHLGLLKLWDDPDDPIRDLLTAMWATGARPGELSKIERRHYEDGIWKLQPHEHKTGDRTDDDRIIAVVGGLIEVVERLCKKYPEGPIFRNSYGRRWDAQALYVRFETARRKKVIRKKVVPYSYRHAWATNALEDGKLTEWEVAKALGHTTTQMVQLHYDKSRRNVAHMKGIFERADRG
jgi:integrase